MKFLKCACDTNFDNSSKLTFKAARLKVAARQEIRARLYLAAFSATELVETAIISVVLSFKHFQTT